MLEVTDIEIKTRLAFDNPWWEEGAVPDQFREWRRRAYFHGFMELVQQRTVNRAVVLMGPRRVGKTVMLTQAVQQLIEDGISPTSIFFISVDTPTYTGLSLEKLLRLFLDIHGHGRGDSLYVAFDEIQYHADWERHLKSLVDSYPTIQFVVSGSAAAAQKTKSVESGAGRFTDYLLPPLSFAEFLLFRKVDPGLVWLDGKKPKIPDIEALNRAFVDYINFGGFPEAVLDPTVRANMDRYVANDIVDKVLLRDIPSLYGIPDTQELKKFFTVLAYNTGSEISLERLSQVSGVAKNTLKKYLDYLEAAFLIRRLHRIGGDAKRFKRVTRFKVHLTNPSIRSALFGPITGTSDAMGPLAETAVLCQFAQSRLGQNIHYAGWKEGEVDIVLSGQSDPNSFNPIELKWSDRVASHPADELRALIEFCKNTNCPVAWLYTKSTATTMDIDGVRINIGVLSAFCYAVAMKGIDEPLQDGLDPRAFAPFGESG